MLVITVFISLVTLVKSIEFPNSIEGAPSVSCGEGSLTISFNTRDQAASRVFAKGFHEQQGCYFENVNEATFALSNCNMNRKREIEPRGVQYELVVVIQLHPLFITKVDRAYHISCFYMEADKMVTVGFDVNPLTTQMLESAHAMPQCTYTLHQGSPEGPAVRYTSIGEQLYHVWQCPSDVYGMLVHSCYVSDGQGQEILVLDENGCGVDEYVLQTPVYNVEMTRAQQSVHVFKFADRMGVTFQCQIKLCFRNGDACNGVTPPLCRSLPNRRQSGSSGTIQHDVRSMADSEQGEGGRQLEELISTQSVTKATTTRATRTETRTTTTTTPTTTTTTTTTPAQTTTTTTKTLPRSTKRVSLITAGAAGSRSEPSGYSGTTSTPAATLRTQAPPGTNSPEVEMMIVDELLELTTTSSSTETGSSQSGTDFVEGSGDGPAPSTLPDSTVQEQISIINAVTPQSTQPIDSEMEISSAVVTPDIAVTQMITAELEGEADAGTILKEKPGLLENPRGRRTLILAPPKITNSLPDSDKINNNNKTDESRPPPTATLMQQGAGGGGYQQPTGRRLADLPYTSSATAAAEQIEQLKKNNINMRRREQLMNEVLETDVKQDMLVLDSDAMSMVPETPSTPNAQQMRRVNGVWRTADVSQQKDTLLARLEQSSRDARARLNSLSGICLSTFGFIIIIVTFFVAIISATVATVLFLRYRPTQQRRRMMHIARLSEPQCSTPTSTLSSCY